MPVLTPKWKEKEAYRLYVEEGWPQQAVAKELGIGLRTLRRCIIEGGGKVRRPGWSKRTPHALEEEICRLYREGLSTYELGEKFGKGNHTIWYILKRKGERTRTPKEARALGERRGKKFGTPFATTPEEDKEVIRLYRDEKLGTPEVAKRLGLKSCTVRNVLVRYGIERRGTSDYLKGKPKTEEHKQKLSESKYTFSRETRERWRYLYEVEGWTINQIAREYKIGEYDPSGKYRGGDMVGRCLRQQGVDTSQYIPTFEDVRERGRKVGLEISWIEEEFDLQYKNVDTLIPWECRDGHKPKRSLNQLQRLQKCPDCPINIGEEIVRQYFQTIFQKPFPKSYPDWLKIGKNDRNRLHLDGFNETLKLAFEHHGRHHYEDVPWFGKGRSVRFERRKENDRKKRRLCNKNGVDLIEIPGLNDLLPLEELRGFIKKELLKLGRKIPGDFDSVEVNLTNLPGETSLQKLIRVSLEKQIECFATAWLGTKYKYPFRCLVCKHEWQTLSTVIQNTKKNHGCPKCAYKRGGQAIRKYTPERIKEWERLVFEEGLSKKDVAKRFGVHWSLVYRYLKAHKTSATEKSRREGKL